MSISKEHIKSVLHRMSILVQHKLTDCELDVLADIWFNLFQFCDLDNFNEVMRAFAKSARSLPRPVDIFEAMDAPQTNVEAGAMPMPKRRAIVRAYTSIGGDVVIEAKDADELPPLAVVSMPPEQARELAFAITSLVERMADGSLQ